MSSEQHIGTRQLYPIKGGYYVPAETFVLLQDYDEKDWPEIVSVVAAFTNGYSSKVCLTDGEVITLLNRFDRRSSGDERSFRAHFSGLRSNG
jgi:hypothetical protein